MTISPGFIGIDISKSTLDIFDSTLCRSERIANTDAAIASLIERWRAKAVFVLFEATGHYDRLLQLALHGAGIGYARVNPQRAREFARAAGFLAKTDAVDARMLAMMAERMRPRADTPASPERARLYALHRRRDQLVLMRQQERTRHSEASSEEEREHLQQHIGWLSQAIRDVEARIRQLVASVETLSKASRMLRMAPGIGPVAATTLLALMPELGTRSPKTIAALAGLAPFNRDSGIERGKRSISGGRKRVRDALYMAALAAVRSSAHFRAIYNRLLTAGKAKKLALIAVARKLLIALNAMIRDGKPFAPA
jgi:transposase